MRDIPIGNRVLVRKVVKDRPHTLRHIVQPPYESRLKTYLDFHPPNRYLDLFTISFRADESTNGVKLVESLRRKYRFTGGTVEGKTQNRTDIDRSFPLFRRLPQKSIEFCAKVLDGVTRSHPTMHVPFGKAYLFERTKRTTKYLGFGLESTAMRSLHNVLKEQFRPIKKEHSRMMGYGKQDGFDWDLWIRSPDGRAQVLSDWAPRIKVAEVEDDAAADAILKDLQKYEGKGFGLELVGLRLHLLPRMEVWRTQGGISMGKQYLEFPFSEGELVAPRVLAPDSTRNLMEWYLNQNPGNQKSLIPNYGKFLMNKPHYDRLSTPNSNSSYKSNPGARHIQLRPLQQENSQELQTEYTLLSLEQNAPGSSPQSQNSSSDPTNKTTSTTFQQRPLVRRLQQRF